MLLLQMQKQIEVMSSCGMDTASLDDEVFNTEAAQDRCILRLIASCCNGESSLIYNNVIHIRLCIL